MTPDQKRTDEEGEARFDFGVNWKSFLSTIDSQRIAQAEQSLQSILGIEGQRLEGKRFLDIGSGSGLFSLAAVRLGATVVSLDYDPQSVACTSFLKQKYANDAGDWQIHQASVLDDGFLRSLGEFDVVYSWGVLHHTGDMRKAIANTSERIVNGGKMVIAIYNDQGGASRRWLRIKQIYNQLPRTLRPIFAGAIATVYETKFAIARLVKGQNPLPFHDWKQKRLDRGMSVWHDWVDWIGGLPFEVAKPEEIIIPLREQGFVLNQLKTVGNGWGCNEYVFESLQT